MLVHVAITNQMIDQTTIYKKIYDYQCYQDMIFYYYILGFCLLIGHVTLVSIA